MTQERLFKPTTKNGYSLDEVASTIQKAIRRGDEKTALFFALELFPFYSKYLWKRLQVVSVEDIENPEAGAIVSSIRSAFFWNNEDKSSAKDYQNRIFITKTVLYLCREIKSREADHAQAYIDQITVNEPLPEIPEYAYDVHTKKGRTMGKKKSDFFTDEQVSLDRAGRDDYYEKLNFETKTE